MKFEEGPPADAAVVQGLSALKREGGSILVVGAPRASHTEICERFHGDDAERVLVRTEGTIHCSDAVDAVVERPVKTRSAARPRSAAPSSPDLGSLRREIESTIERVDTDGATLRICFDSLRPFVDTTPRSELVSFLEALRTTARDAGAVMHVHLPAMTDAVPQALYDAVDAVVELNRRGESTYQQWHLSGVEEPSEWVSV